MGFREDLQLEPVSELPLREAVVVSPGALLRNAVAQMRAKSIGCAVVVKFGSSGPPCGLFTERSLIDAAMNNVSLDDRSVGEFADTAFVSVKNTDPIAKVWDAVTQDRARFVVVTDPDGAVIGVTGQRGLAEYASDYFSGQVVVQRVGSTPWMQQREGA